MRNRPFGETRTGRPSKVTVAPGVVVPQTKPPGQIFLEFEPVATELFAQPEQEEWQRPPKADCLDVCRL